MQDVSCIKFRLLWGLNLARCLPKLFLEVTTMAHSTLLVFPVKTRRQENLTLQCMMLSAICFSCAGAHQETLSYLWSSSCFRRLAGSTGIGAPDARASCLASTRCSSSFRDRPCRSTSSSLSLANQGISSLEFQAKNAHVDQWPLHCIKTNKACHI